MPINETLSTYSNWTYGAAVAVYVLAMVFYLVEQAWQRTARKATEAKVLVGAGGPQEDAATGTYGPFGSSSDKNGPRVPVSRAERIGRMAVSLTVLGVLLHLVSLVLRGFAAHRVPWGNMYEFGALLSFVAMVTWLVLLRKYPVRHLGGFVLLPIVLLMFIGGTLLYTTAAPVQPALQSYWLVIHVFTVASSSGALLVPGVASVLYLIKINPDRFRTLAARLPSADTLDRLAYRVTIIAFPAYTLGVIFGEIGRAHV